MVKVAVVGSRNFLDMEQLNSVLDTIHKEIVITLIVSGGARGADSFAKSWAIRNKIDTKIFKPDWKKYGKAAGLKRNIQIIDAADQVVAFWDGVSKGTKSSIDLAQKANKPCAIYYFSV